MASQEEHQVVGSGDVDAQCNHAEGLGDLHHPADDDPIMEKQNWDLDDWNHVYGKMPASESKGQPSQELVKYVNLLLPSEPARVLVPLSGKSPDLRWLYERGNWVVGVEGVEKPVREFYQLYPDLNHSVLNLPYGKLYKSEDERLLVYVCDITRIPAGALGKFDAGFDWGAYTAIVPGDRRSYVEVVKEAMKEDSRYFLEVCHDGPPDVTYLPHSIPFRDIKLDFGGGGRKMEVLATKDVSREWDVDTFFNSYILFTPAAN